jgi:hypothetical protein
MLEAQIKTALMTQLMQRGRRTPLQFVAELMLESGMARADLVETTTLHCYEIKSEADSLARLIQQGERYGKVFRYVTLVAAERHLARALPLLPPWWGVLQIPANGEGKFRTIRVARLNGEQAAYDLATTLGREECMDVLDQLSMTRGWRSKSLYLIQQYLAATLPVPELSRHVIAQLSRRGLQNVA